MISFPASSLQKIKTVVGLQEQQLLNVFVGVPWRDTHLKMDIRIPFPSIKISKPLIKDERKRCPFDSTETRGKMNQSSPECYVANMLRVNQTLFVLTDDFQHGPSSSKGFHKTCYIIHRIRLVLWIALSALKTTGTCCPAFLFPLDFKVAF